MAFINWLSEFFHQGSKQSSTRLVAILAGFSACVVAIICACTGKEQAATVAALMGGGAVALLTRKKDQS